MVDRSGEGLMTEDSGTSQGVAFSLSLSHYLVGDDAIPNVIFHDAVN